MRSTWTRLLAVLTLASVLALPVTGYPQNSPFPLSVTTQMQSAVAATGNGTAMPVNQMQVATIQVSGTFTATVSFQGSSDGTNYQALTCYTLDSSTSATSASAAGIWRCNVGGLQLIRTPVTWSSGTSVTVWATASSAGGPIRDVTSASGAITGQLRGTQTTAPTCSQLNGNSVVALASSCVVDGGTDSFVRAHVTSVAQTAAQASGNVVVTFNTSYAAAPACVAALDDASTGYGYYLYAVSPTTTAVTIKLSEKFATIIQGTWSPQQTFSLLCAGVQ